MLQSTAQYVRLRSVSNAKRQGTIASSEVISQLEAEGPPSKPFLFFYFRRLWKPDALEELTAPEARRSLAPRSRFAHTVRYSEMQYQSFLTGLVN